MTHFRNFYFAGLLCGLLGCGHPKEPVPPLHDRVIGSLTTNLAKVRAGRFTGNCDRNFSSQQDEVARALDARSEDILRLASMAIPMGFDKVELPPTFFVAQNPKAQPGADNWERRTKSWQSIFSTYRALKDLPTDIKWVRLDAAVRSILSDDRARTIFGYDSGLDHTAGPLLENLQKELLQCRANAACGVPVLSKDLQDLIQRNTYLNYAWQELLKSRIGSTSHTTNLNAMLKVISKDVQRFNFVRNPAIQRDTHGQMTLPLFAGVFVNGTDLLSSFIESVWKNDSVNLRLQWTPAITPQTYSLLLDPTQPFARSNVDRQRLIVQLYPGTNVRGIAHEIGHVLGFTDHYYTLWDNTSCSYSIEENKGDIMSSSLTGSVTADEWAELLRSY